MAAGSLKEWEPVAERKDNIIRTAVEWNPQEKRTRGGPKQSLRRTILLKRSSKCLKDLEGRGTMPKRKQETGLHWSRDNPSPLERLSGRLTQPLKVQSTTY